jgi:hypothetical protein
VQGGQLWIEATYWRIQLTMNWPWPGEAPLVWLKTLSGKGPSAGWAVEK